MQIFHGVIDFMIDCFFIIDILVNLRTAYMHDGEVIINSRKVRAVLQAGMRACHKVRHAWTGQIP
jgi:hypothetical protein